MFLQTDSDVQRNRKCSEEQIPSKGYQEAVFTALDICFGNLQ